MHGAETMFPVTNCIVAPRNRPRSRRWSSLTVKAMEGFDNHVEPSPAKFRGLSHREIGDYSDTLPFSSKRRSPSSTSRPGPRPSSFSSTAKTPSSSAWPRRKSCSFPMMKTAGRWRSASASTARSPSRSSASFRRRIPTTAIRVTESPATPKSWPRTASDLYFHDPAAADKTKISYE